MATKPIDNSKIPDYVTHVTTTLEKAKFEAFLVGGCVRDLIMGRLPKDWDITTNATPEEIIPLFEKTVYENAFGTVGVCMPKVTRLPETGTVGQAHEITENVARVTENSVTHETYHIVEVTPYRIEAKYSDFRHPDEVKFSKNIEDDLKRRDFTVNALAYLPTEVEGNIKGPADAKALSGRQEGKQSNGHLIDLFSGVKDIKDKVIRAVGNPEERFQEDALRMLRAIRFSTQLDFAIDSDTIQAIVDNSHLLKNISAERIRDEFVKIIESPRPAQGVGLLQKLGLLKYIIPELEEGIGCEQGGAHIYDVFEHLLGALGHAADKEFSTNIRLAALFHDIGKPRSRRLVTSPINKKSGPRGGSPDHDFSSIGSVKKKPYTFYGHEVVGARMAKQIMERLKFPKETIEFVTTMVRQHMFFSDTETITLSAVRRVVQKVGKDHIWELMEIRECDRVGMNKKEAPYRLRKYHAMIEEVLHDPISVGALAIDGEVMIKDLKMNPSPRMGWILHALLEEVLDDPKKNEVEYLKSRTLELDKLSDKELRSLGEAGKEKKEELEEEEVKKLHKKHGV